MTRVTTLIVAFALLGCATTAPPQTPSPRLDPGLEATDAQGQLQAFIEIPAGTIAKFEVDKATGAVVQDIKDGKPRFVAFLPYPSNYGMIPKTMSATEDGGDGDPLDVLVLGPALSRGEVVPIRLIGVLELLDGGEADDKLVAVPLTPGPRNPFAHYQTLAELRERQPEVLEIVALWFSAYKGPGEMTLKGWGGPDRAQAILDAAQLAPR